MVSGSSWCRPRKRSGSSLARIRAPTPCCTSPAEGLGGPAEFQVPPAPNFRYFPPFSTPAGCLLLPHSLPAEAPVQLGDIQTWT